MRNLLCGLALATVTFAAPATASDKQFYVGVDAGAWVIPDIKSKGPDFASSGFPLGLVTEAVPAASGTRERVTGHFDAGTDLDVVLGYDFGRIRAEAEFARKHSDFERVTIRNSLFGFILDGTHDTRGSIDALSATVNVLYDLPLNRNVDLYAGPGIGYGQLKLTPRVDLFDSGTFGDELHRTKRSGVMGQLVAGGRFRLTDNFDAGLKYRYVRSQNLTYDAGVLGDLKGHLETHSLLVSLGFNFGRPAHHIAPVAAPVTEPMPPAPVAEPAPAAPVPQVPTGERG
jgi:opacity protein-like surface antigen